MTSNPSSSQNIQNPAGNGYTSPIAKPPSSFGASEPGTHPAIAGHSPGRSNPALLPLNQLQSSSPDGAADGARGSFDNLPQTEAAVPKLGGPLQTYDEKFDLNPVTGSCSLTIPIDVPVPGRNGFHPRLALSYSSGNGRSPFGFGWSLNIDAITRAGIHGRGIPNYEANGGDVFSLSGGEYLAQIDIYERSAEDGAGYVVKKYQPRITSGNVARIEYWSNKTGVADAFWKVVSSDNTTAIYGDTVESRISNPANPDGEVYSWLLSETYDCKGNAVIYNYRAEDTANVPSDLASELNRAPLSNRYLVSAKYGNTKLFPRAGRGEYTGSWLYEVKLDYGNSGPEGRWEYRSDPFSTYRNGFEIRTYRLCKRILMYGPEDLADGRDPLVRAVDLEYDSSGGMNQLKSIKVTGYAGKKGSPQEKSMSLPPFCLDYTQAPAPKSLTLETTEESVADAGESGIGPSLYRFIDMEGEGAPSLVKRNGNGWFSKKNLSLLKNGGGAAFGEWQQLYKPMPNSLSSMLTDIDGDSRLEMVDWSSSGFYRQDPDGNWEDFREFSSVANIDMNDPALRFVDLTGDGLADILIVNGDDGFLWHRSLGTEGYARAERVGSSEKDGPKLVFTDPSEAIYLADMTGDGGADLVRIRNSEITYWPNLGYGRFGSKLVLDNGPGTLDSYEEFSPARCFLADTDGSGTADLLYMPSDGQGGINLYKNLNGSRWSDPVYISQFPVVDDISTVTTADLFGTGTECLVWLRPDMRISYIDLSAGGNRPNLLQSYSNGLGLETELRYTSSYQMYLEDELTPGGKPWTKKLSIPVQCVTKRIQKDTVVSDSPPVVTRYRYRNGYYDAHEREFRGFEMAEVWDVDEDAAVGSCTTSWYHLGGMYSVCTSDYQNKDNVLHCGLPNFDSSFDPADGYRALKGTLLHSETADLSGCLYSVEDHAQAVVLLANSKTGGPHAVFQVHPLESVTCAIPAVSEGSPPRKQRTLVMEVDGYGNVLKSASVSYGSTLATADPEQKKTWLIYSETQVTNAIDDAQSGSFRVPAQQSSKSFEVEYSEGVPITDLVNGPNKKLISQQRSTYLSDDLTTSLQQGKLESLGLMYKSYSLAFIKETLAAYGDEKLPMDEGGYVDLDSDGNWWTQSSTTTYSDATSFYTPTGTVDQWGNQSVIEYDPCLLFPIKATDALNNTTNTTYNYFSGQQVKTIDMNGNVTVVEYDPLGRALRQALLAGGDSLTGSTTDVPPRSDETIEEWARNFLGNATSGTVTDYSNQPFAVYNVTREKFADPQSKLMLSVGYHDGRGRALQGKTLSSSSPPKWLGSGWTVFDNRNQPVREYEPFYSSTHEYEKEKKEGEFVMSFYDALKRDLGTLYPDGTWRKTVYGVWRVEEWDQGDTVGKDIRDDKDIGRQVPSDAPSKFDDVDGKGKVYMDSPTVKVLDSMGRTYKAILNNGRDGNGQPLLYSTLTVLSIQGKVLGIVDSLGRTALSNDYDMLNRTIHSVSIDNGEKWLFSDVNSAEVLHWSPRGKIKQTYDALRRPLDEIADGKVTISHCYGESSEAKGDQLRGRLYRIRDQVGEEIYHYDFRGLVLKVQRQLTTEFKRDIDWKKSGKVKLEDEKWETRRSFDALGRTTNRVDPNGYETTFEYNGLGQLIKVKAGNSVTMSGIEYDHRGRQTKSCMGNGCATSFVYDPKTLQLSRKTTSAGTSKTLQDILYEYDAVGNVTKITDNADRTYYFRGSIAKPEMSYSYDAIQRLVHATGRENLNQLSADSSDLTVPIPDTHPSNAVNMANYEEDYVYDNAGNIQSVKHSSSNTKNTPGSNWTRKYNYIAGTNRLESTTIGDVTTSTFNYGDNGLPSSMGKLKLLQWDYMDRMSSSSPILEEAEGVSTFYRYDSSGRRVRKVAQKGGAGRPDLVRETLYFGENYERFWLREGGKSVPDEAVVHTNHVRGVGGERTATVETQEGKNPLIRYHVSDHLESVSVELGEEGEVVKREEYSPYGQVRHSSGAEGGSGVPRRYRFAARDRDKETGLYYCLHRYLIPGIGRWLSPDPIGVNGGLNLYCYVACNPINSMDPDGLINDPTKPSTSGFARKRPLQGGRGGGSAAKTTKTAPTDGPIYPFSGTYFRVQNMHMGIRQKDKPEEGSNVLELLKARRVTTTNFAYTIEDVRRTAADPKNGNKKNIPLWLPGNSTGHMYVSQSGTGDTLREPFEDKNTATIEDSPGHKSPLAGPVSPKSGTFRGQDFMKANYGNRSVMSFLLPSGLEKLVKLPDNPSNMVPESMGESREEGESEERSLARAEMQQVAGLGIVGFRLRDPANPLVLDEDYAYTNWQDFARAYERRDYVEAVSYGGRKLYINTDARIQD